MVANNGNDHGARAAMARETGSIDPSISNMEDPSHFRYKIYKEFSNMPPKKTIHNIQTTQQVLNGFD